MEKVLPPEILKKVKLLEISTRKLVNNVFSGEYHTHFKGQGMTFSDFREYVAGDDVRAISWTLTARAGKPYIKTYEEERELTLILAVDVSGSTDFGSGAYFKGEVMVHLAAVLAYSAAKNNDQIGLLLFSDQVEHFVPPKKGRSQVHRILRDLLYFRPKSSKTSLDSAASYLQGILKKRAAIFFLSDFHDQNYEISLRALGQKHDVVACVVHDAMERDLPDFGLLEIQDPETGQVITIDTGSAKFRQLFKTKLGIQKDLRDSSLRRAHVDRIDIRTDQDTIDPLVAYFKRRRR